MNKTVLQKKSTPLFLMIDVGLSPATPMRLYFFWMRKI